jgi:hypothetical protein
MAAILTLEFFMIFLPPIKATYTHYGISKGLIIYVETLRRDNVIRAVALA